MKPRATLLLGWLLTGFAAVVGSVLGRTLGPSGLFAGAVAGGVVGVVASVTLAIRFGWLPVSARWGAIAGGIGGFAVAAPIAALNLHTPIVPVVSGALVGAGMLFGVGLARRG